MSTPRKANVSIDYNGKNITTSLAEYMKSFSYTDVASGESDSIAINISDRDKKWINNWMPEKGDNMNATITMENWDQDGDYHTFHCGRFTIDDLSFSGRPITGTIGAVSIPATESFKTTERTQTWQEVTIESIAREIAVRANIALSYEAAMIKIKSIEQPGQSDCEFLYKLCNSYGLAMKVYSNKIIIFDEAIYESKPSVATIDESEMDPWNYNTTLTGTYTGAEITYTDANTEEDIKVTVGSGTRIYKVNEKADSLQDAELKAIANVNNANKSMTTMRITIKANRKIVASSNVEITGCGKLNGKYAVDKVKHSIGSKYTMSLELRKIQNRIRPNIVAGASTANGIPYTIKSGDTLWAISKKYLGSGAKYKVIYDANADVIEAAAKSRGKANSNNGNRIYPGTVIIIPV